MKFSARLAQQNYLATQQSGLDPRIHTSFDHLKSLQPRVRKLNFLPRQKSKSILAGRHASRIRGRGLSFEELRDYRVGDDIRTIDWRVTARTGKPHVRVYAEEKDRSAILIVDQRVNMFFGSQHNVKSVSASEAAAICAYAIFEQGDRVGAVIFNDDEVRSFRPSKRPQMLEQIVHDISDMNLALHCEIETPATRMSLNRPLEEATRLVQHDQLIIVISDFDEIDHNTEHYLDQMAAHNDVILVVVNDPLSRNLPPNMQFPVSDGKHQMTLDTAHPHVHQQLQNAFTQRLATIYSWQDKLNTTVLELQTSRNTLDQFVEAFAVLK